MIEDPITREIQTIFSSTGAVLHPVPVDEQGMKTDLIPLNKKTKIYFCYSISSVSAWGNVAYSASNSVNRVCQKS